MSEEEGKPLSEALDQLLIIFTELLKMVTTPGIMLSEQAFFNYYSQLEKLEQQIADLKLYLERRVR